MNTILCGIRPTGKIHIGNYLGVIKPGIELDATFMVAKYHSEADTKESEEFRDNLNKVGCNYVYIQPKNNIIEMYKLMKETSVKSLLRMTQYKEKEKTVFMLMYPLLMAVDIKESNCDEVLVGEDQLEHIEFANRLFKKIGYKKVKPIMSKNNRIMDLKDSTKKMSKSCPDGCLFVDDSLAEMKRKFKSAITDEAGIKNLKNIAEEFGVDFNNKYSILKEQLAITIYNKLK